MESQMTRRNGKGLEKTGNLFENIKIKKKKKYQGKLYITRKKTKNYWRFSDLGSI